MSRYTSALPLAALAAALWASTALAAGSFSRIQVLLPGESPAPGTTSGKTGTPTAQTKGVPFTFTVRACDSNWNLVTSVTDVVDILSSDATATLPPSAPLASGTASFPLTFNAGGTFTVFAHDHDDNTIPDGTSSPVTAMVLQSFTFSAINQKNQYAGVPMTITVTARDPSGAQITGYNGPVHLDENTSLGDGRCSPDSVTMSGGSWTGAVTMYRADETSINRGNVNLVAFLGSANGSSDPFTVHPGSFSRLQLVVPGESPLPGSVSGKVGVPATQISGRAFSASVWSTDNWWNPVPSADNVRLTSSDGAANTPQTGALSNGYRAFSVTLGTVGTQTLAVTDLTDGTKTGMTSPGIPVIPSALDHFVVGAIGSPQTAGVQVTVTIRAADASGNTVTNYAGDAFLTANTGTGSISPELIGFTAGVWTGPMTFKGAAQAVAFTCSDYFVPPHTGASNSFQVNPGPVNHLQVLLPGETPNGGTADGKTGTPNGQQAGTAFTVTVRAVDQYWNLVTGVGDSVALGSSDAFAAVAARVALANGQALVPTTLYTPGAQRIWASDVTQPAVLPDTSSAVTVTGGTFSRVLILAPGESNAPGTPSGKTGTATDQSINYSFNVTVLATDQWWNPVTGVTDVVHITSDDPGATLPADQALVDGRGEMSVRLVRGGYNLITVADVTRPSIQGSNTQVVAISSGFHLVASVTPASVGAGEAFTLTVKVVNDAGSTIREINSDVTLQALNASTLQPGRGALLPSRFSLIQGERSVTETYSFAEPIVIRAQDDAGNAPATSNQIAITPGPAAAVRLSAPTWMGGNKHVTLTATLVDAYDNGISGVAMSYLLVSGNGTLTPIDNVTAADGSARADFLSPRTPERDSLRASAAGFGAGAGIEVTYVDPDAPAGSLTNYPNPFQPSKQPTTISYKLSDQAAVTLRIFDQNGSTVLERTYARGGAGGSAGLNEVTWDGKNGKGETVSSGGYVLLVEAQGTGGTLHVIRRKIGVVR
ncbi:MAG TPA: FlgD immunoglobulin-like domain containing protein [Candidatus Eisenbacteria bacterium]|jgi:hypothetical protein